MMVATVDDGTATPAQIPGVQVAGKTGTAQSTGRPAALRLVRLVRPGRRPPGRRRGAGRSRATPRADEIGGGRLGGPIAKAVMEAVINQ